METGGSLAAPDSAETPDGLHAKAKGSPDFRFYSLSDKVWRAVLEAAWQTVRRNGGAWMARRCSVETQGVLGELARDLKEGSYRPGAVRQVLIPKKQAGKYRALGIPCVRDRVAQTAALVVLAPMKPWNRSSTPIGSSAQDAVKRVHRLLNRGHREVVDVSNYFGEIPHAELMRSVARRVSDGRLLGWIKAWLESRRQGWQTPHEPSATGEEGDAARRAGLTPDQQHLHATLHSGLEGIGQRPTLQRRDRELRRRLRGLRQSPRGYDEGRCRGMQRLRLPINVTKTRNMRVPDEPLDTALDATTAGIRGAPTSARARAGAV